MLKKVENIDSVPVFFIAGNWCEWLCHMKHRRFSICGKALDFFNLQGISGSHCNSFSHTLSPLLYIGRYVCKGDWTDKRDLVSVVIKAFLVRWWQGKSRLRILISSASFCSINCEYIYIFQGNKILLLLAAKCESGSFLPWHPWFTLLVIP